MAANTTTFQDSTGEEPGSPDITTIVVSNDDAGMLTFRVNIPNRPTLDQGTVIEIWVDTDSKPTTGSRDLGARLLPPARPRRDESVQVGWLRLHSVSATGSDPVVQLSGGVTVRINASELSNTKKLTFFVDVVTGCTSTL